MNVFDDLELDTIKKVLTKPRTIRELQNLCSIKYPATAMRRLVALCQRDGLKLVIDERREGRAGPASRTYRVQ
jgi:hypothetical protein